MKKTYIFPLFLIFVTVLALCAFVLSRQNNFGADEYINDICELSNLNDELNETDYCDSSETTNAKSLLNNADLITKEGKKLLKDFKDIFGEYFDYIDLKPYEASMVFEGYLRCGKDIDRQIFKASYFEDLVYGSKDNINIYEFIKNYLMTLPINEGAKNAVTKRDMLETVVAGHSRIVRAIAYIIFDSELFKLYIIDILNRKPKVLRTLVKIKHMLFGMPKDK